MHSEVVSDKDYHEKERLISIIEDEVSMFSNGYVTVDEDITEVMARIKASAKKSNIKMDVGKYFYILPTMDNKHVIRI